MFAFNQCSETNTAAIPIPYPLSVYEFGTKISCDKLTVPTHIDVTATLLFCLLSSDNAVTIWRAPVQPSGWPRALEKDLATLPRENSIQKLLTLLLLLG